MEPLVITPRSIIDLNGKLPLHQAAANFRVQELRELLEQRGCDPNEVDEEGRTALHVLLSDEYRGHMFESEMEACLQVLIGKGQCHINAVDGSGESPLSLAVMYEFESAALILVRFGADAAVRTLKLPDEHSLASKIALTMPKVMMEILDSGITDNSKVPGQPPKITLDWRPLLQYYYPTPMAESEADKKKQNVQRETSFLYSLLDIPVLTRSEYLTHPLVAAFMHLRIDKTRMHLIFVQVLMALYPICYMIFVYFLYFVHCKPPAKEDSNDNDNATTTEDEAEPPANDNFIQHRCEMNAMVKISAFFLSLVIVGLALLECYMLFRVDLKYLKSWRSWVIRISLLIMGFTLWPALRFEKKSYDISWQYSVAAIGTFFAWVMFLFQMELIPEVKVYLEMLATIILEVLKIILLFFPLFIGFYMGLSLMYSQFGGVMTFIEMTIDSGSDETEKFIQSTRDPSEWITILANTFNVVFTVVISIVFMNFLLGVSINDIQELKRNAQVMGLSHRVQNVFIINLIFPYYFNVVTESDIQAGNWTCSYQPSNEGCMTRNKFDENILRDITLFLKSKKQEQASQRRQNEESLA